MSAESAIEDLTKDAKKTVNCYSCGIDCTRSRYHYARTAATSGASGTSKLKYDICGNCFRDNRQPESHDRWEFVKLEDSEYSSIPDRERPWTDAELLRLLEALELFDDNWDSIADHVETRTREECVLRFLQLEIEDKYLDSNVSDVPISAALDNGRTPFTQADNPVLTVVSFLAGMSEPSVAAAAAGRSVQVMRKAMRRRIEGGLGGSAHETDKDEQGMKTEDLMEVDAVESPQANENNAITVRENGVAPPSLETVALAVSAARAGALASIEEREMTRVVSGAMNTSLQKLELKMQHFSEMEAALQAERRELERGRQQLFLDRLSFRRRLTEAEDAMRLASLKGGEEGARMIRDISYDGDRLAFHHAQDPTQEHMQALSGTSPTYKNLDV